MRRSAAGVRIISYVSEIVAAERNLTITDDSLVIEPDQARIDAEAALDGFYVA